MGMTLSQYMSQMPSREAAAGERCVQTRKAVQSASQCHNNCTLLCTCCKAVMCCIDSDICHFAKCQHMQSSDWAKGYHMLCGSCMAVTMLDAKSALHCVHEVLAA